MRFSSLMYCLNQGFKNIVRNRIFSIASIATMSLCIFLLGLFYSITANMNYMVDKMTESLCVKVFFNKNISESGIEGVGERIADYNGVTLIHYTSAEEAWDTYKEKYFGEKYIELAEGYAEDNPLKDSASYEVYFENPDMQSDLVKYIENIQGVKKVVSSEATAEGLTQVGNLVSIVSVGILLILLIIALFLISNTISIGITVRDEEIQIMKLIGARNSFIRAPFVVEGIAIGTAGAIIPLIVLFIMYRNVIDYFIGKYSFLSTILTFMPAGKMFVRIVPISLAIGIGLGLLGSTLSLRKHLKK